MRTCSIASLAAVLVLSAASASAQDIPKPAPELSQLSFFEGSWSCTGKMLPSPLGPAGSMTSTADVRKDLGGFWQSGMIKGTLEKLPPFEGRFHTTWDPAAKQFVMLWVDNLGGWSLSRSAGWKGEVMAYEGESHMGPQTVKSRDTFTRSGTAMMRHSWEAEVGGKWMPLGEETCKKK